ncbi:MAG: HypC/HybG/HupF family hydrogenase formation chaperone [Deltaproteobacteria bacterium]
MCLGIPAKIISVDGPFAKVEIGGTKKDCSIELMREASIGDYVIVHAGFAIERLDTEKAEETLRLIAEAMGRS